MWDRGISIYFLKENKIRRNLLNRKGESIINKV